MLTRVGVSIYSKELVETTSMMDGANPSFDGQMGTGCCRPEHSPGLDQAVLHVVVQDYVGQVWRHDSSGAWEMEQVCCADEGSPGDVREGILHSWTPRLRWMQVSCTAHVGGV